MHQINDVAAVRKPPLRGELSGSDCCTAAEIVGRGTTPVLALCRSLLSVGVDPDTSIEIFRNGTLALHIRNLAAAAALELNSKGCGFTVQAVRKPSLIEQNAGRVAA